jgi:sulfide:quinone oxidoreductase
MSDPLHVVIAGGGVSGVEALLALRELAGDRVRVTMVSDRATFALPAQGTRVPFAGPRPHETSLAALCREQGAALHLLARAVEVRPQDHQLVLEDRSVLEFDVLLVAVGARAEPVVPGARVFRGAQDAEALHGVVQDVEDGYVTSVGFVVPPGPCWPLPAYELALMLAQRAFDTGRDDVEVTVLTHERAPLEHLGAAPATQLREALSRAGVTLVPEVEVRSAEHGHVVATDGRLLAEVQRTIALPVLRGPALPGLPQDPDGFIPVGTLGEVPGCPDVLAVGDGTDEPVKQGGVAAAAADAAAWAIARRAGAPVGDPPAAQERRAELLTGDGVLALRSHLGYLAPAPEGGRVAWPTGKVAAPYLTRWLERGREPVLR